MQTLSAVQSRQPLMGGLRGRAVSLEAPETGTPGATAPADPAATLTLSAAARSRPEEEAASEATPEPSRPGASRAKGLDGVTLDQDKQQEVDQLKQRDREVKSHEQAHKAAGGQYAGAVSLSYQTGPDGQKYAIGGEVPIDLSGVKGDPDATVRKMGQVQRAALAPADPSGADQQVASAAAQQAERARQEAAAKRYAAVRDATPASGATQGASNRALAVEGGGATPRGRVQGTEVRGDSSARASNSVEGVTRTLNSRFGVVS